MSDGRITYNITADTTDIERRLDKLEKLFQKVDRAGDDAGEGIRKGADKGGRALEGLKASAEAMGGKVGESAGRVEKLGQAVKAFASSPALLASSAIAGVSLALGGMVAAAGAAVLAADDLHESIKDLDNLEGFGVDPEALASIEAANASLEALEAIAKQMVITVGANLGAAVANTGETLVALALMAQDTWAAFNEGGNILERFAVFLVDGLVQAIAAPISGIANLAGAAGDLLTLLGADELGAALQSVNDTWDGFTETIAKNTVAFYEGAAASALTIEGMESYRERARELIGELQALDEAQGDVKESAKELAVAVTEVNQSFDTDAWNARWKETGDAAEQSAEQARAAAFSTNTAVLSNVEATTGAIQGLMAGTSAEAGAASQALFRLNQTAAIGNIAMHTAEAAAKVAGQTGILAPLAVPAAIAFGAAQAAVVAAQKPPTFHTGGVIGSAANGSGETLIRAQTGESVLTRAATARLGKRGVDALNSGQGMGGGVVQVQQVYRHEVFNRFVTDNLKRRDSPIRKALGGRNSRYGQV